MCIICPLLASGRHLQAVGVQMHHLPAVGHVMLAVPVAAMGLCDGRAAHGSECVIIARCFPALHMLMLLLLLAFSQY
jgi:hypothetical protein